MTETGTPTLEQLSAMGPEVMNLLVLLKLRPQTTGASLDSISEIMELEPQYVLNSLIKPAIRHQTAESGFTVEFEDGIYKRQRFEVNENGDHYRLTQLGMDITSLLLK